MGICNYRLTQESLASRLGVSFVTLNSWINEKSEPRERHKEEINRLAIEFLGSDSINTDNLETLKRHAESTHYSAKELIHNKPLLERLTTYLTYHPNATEGSTMTEQDVEEVMYRNHVLKIRTAIEQREAIDHQTALYFLLDELAASTPDNFRIDSNLIKATHLKLMNGIISDAGFSRTHSVRISGSTAPVANYLMIPGLVADWTNHANVETDDHVFALATLHASFEKIHPFSDGNGHTGRLFLLSSL